MSQGLPILYSFRRCPYAIRARLAIQAAGLLVELREVALRAKPPELLAASPKGTVPVLVLGPDAVVKESLGVMEWALGQHDPGDWLRSGAGPGPAAQRQRIEALVTSNDGPFKFHLDRYRYPDRFPGVDPLEHRAEAAAILGTWNQQLGPSGWLVGDTPSLADVALLPFVRQFRLADPDWFDHHLALPGLQGWLAHFLESPELAVAMQPAAPWSPTDPPRLFPPDGRIHHLALAEEWEAAQAEGVYRCSTRGLSLEQVGFLHASFHHQIAGTHARFYADVAELVLLSIDPARVDAALRLEAAPGTQVLFPHLYGPLPLGAVVAVERWPC